MKKYLIVLFAAMTFVFTGCVDDLGNYGIVEQTTICGRVVDEQFVGMEWVNVAVTNGSRNHAIATTDWNGRFEMNVNYREIDDSYYLLLSYQEKTRVFKLQGIGQYNYDYRDLPFDISEYRFTFGGRTYMIAPPAYNNMTWDDAKAYCHNLTLDGYSDWRLPTKDELKQMYIERESIGGFGTGWWWSGTESSTSYAYCVDFTDGEVSSRNKYYYYSVRPVRVE